MPLTGLRVVELATIIAGPGCGRYLADFGADVIKVERPGAGDTTRGMGWRDPEDDVTFWWKLLGRNKRTITLDLKVPDDRDLLLRLLDDADVLIENFRPGKLEALGLAPEVLLARNPRLVITRVSGFGQDGPYAGRAGFATLAEAMSGFAAVNGSANGGPTLPPVAMADEITALAAAFATMVAVHSGVGQVVDVNLLESMLAVMGPLAGVHARTGWQQPRLGSQIPYSVPRNTYRCADGRWVAVSTSSESVARRVLDLVGIGDDPRYADLAGRIAHRDELDAAVAAWVLERTADDVVAAFEAAEAACATVLDVAGIRADPHVVARGSFVELDGVVQQGPIARLSATPARLRWAGRAPDADGPAIRREADRAGT